MAILCTPTCSTAIQTMRVFRDAGVNIALVVVELSPRTSLSPSERAFRDAHGEFARRTGSTSVGQADWIGRAFLALPGWAKALVRRWHHRLPVVRRRAVRHHAGKLGIEVISVARHSCQLVRDSLEQRGIEHVLLCSSGWLIKEPLVSMSPPRIINTHSGPLPKHRSLDSMAWSVLAGDPVGLTAHFVDAGVDTGPVLFFREIVPRQGDTLVSLRQRLQDARPEVFLTACRGLSSAEIKPTPQPIDGGEHHRPMTVDELLRAESVLQERLGRTAGPGR